MVDRASSPQHVGSFVVPMWWRPHRLGWTWSRWLPVFLCGVAFLCRAGLVLMMPETVAADSNRYMDREHPWVPFQVWNGMGPGLLSQVVFLLPGRFGLVAQVLLAGLMWCIVVMVVSAGRFGILLGLVASLWANTPWIWLWDSWFLTEALSLPALALAAVGSVAVAAGELRSRALVLAFGGAAVAVAARPFLFSIALALPVLALTIGGLGRLPRRRLVRVLGATLVIAAFGAVQTTTFESRAADGRVDAVRATDRLWGRAHLPGYLTSARASGMPDCPDVAAALSTRAEGALRTVRESACPGYQAWLDHGGLPWVNEVLEHPWVTVRAMTDHRYWVDLPYRQYTAYDSRSVALKKAVGDGWVTLVHALNIAIFFLMAAGVLFAPLMCRRNRRLLVFALLGLGALAGAAAGLWLVDGIELWRHLLPVFVAVVPLSAAVIAASPDRSH